MAAFPGSPRVLRGALVSVDPSTLESVVVPLQYNPALVQRAYQIAATTQGAGAGQRAGSPTETVQIEVVLDATEQGNGNTGSVSSHIAAILGLASQPSNEVLDNLQRASQGMIDILPPSAPLVLFVYGPRRVQPVVLTEISVAEEAHSPSLAPLRARVSLGMQVLRHTDVPAGQLAHALSLANQIVQEARAAQVEGNELVATIVRSTLESL